MSRRKSAVFMRMLRLNMVIVAVICVSMFFLSILMRNALRYNEQNVCNTNLEYGLEQLNSQLQSVSGNIISYLREQVYREGSSGLHRYDAVNLLKARDTLRSIVSNSPMVGEIAYVCEKQDLVVTTNSVYYSVDDFLKIYQIHGMDQSRFYDYLQDDAALATIRFFPCASVGCWDKASFDTAFCCGVPLDVERYTVNRGVAFVFFSLQDLVDITIPKHIQPYASLYLYDNRSAQSDTPLFVYSSSEEEEDYFETVLVNASSTLRACIRISNRYLSAQMKTVNIFIFCIILVALLVGIGSAMWSAYRQSLPMRQIIQHLRGYGLLLSPDANEYSELVHSVDTLISEKESISRQMNDYQIFLENSLLDRLFSSTALRRDAEEALLMQMERFPERSLVYCGRVFISSADTNTSMEMTVIMLLEFLKKRLPENAILHSTDTMTFGLVYPCPEDMETAEGHLRQMIDAAQQRFSARIVLVRGGLCDGIGQIGTCFERAQMSYVPYSGRNEQGNQPVLPSEEEEGGDQSLRLRSLQTISQLIISGNAEKAVEEMRRFYMDASDGSQVNMRERYSVLRVHIMLSCREIQENFPCPVIPHFRPDHSLRQQMEALETAICDICARVRERQVDGGGGQDDRLNAFTDYLSRHYSDPELCASSLATEFHVSEKYLFGLFKKKTGYSPTSYLHHIRMEEASRRLKECDDTVQEISASVGFANFGTFYKAFKREYGVAPGKYREQHRSRA